MFLSLASPRQLWSHRSLRSEFSWYIGAFVFTILRIFQGWATSATEVTPKSPKGKGYKQGHTARSELCSLLQVPRCVPPAFSNYQQRRILRCDEGAAGPAISSDQPCTGIHQLCLRVSGTPIQTSGCVRLESTMLVWLEQSQRRPEAPQFRRLNIPKHHRLPRTSGTVQSSMSKAFVHFF